MENNKSFKVMAIIALCVSVIGVSVAFASLSEDLTIDSNGMFDPVTWDIHFENLTETPTLVGEAQNDESVGPFIENDQLISYGFVFSAPGDSYSIKFDVVNAGDLNAEISGIVGNDVKDWTYNAVVAGAEGNELDTRDTAAADTALVMNNLIFSLTYDDENKTPVAEGDTLEAGTGTGKTMVLTVTYNPEATAVPTGLVEILPESLVITYTQKN